MKCDLCPHACEIPPHALGFCGARANINNAVVCVNYGRVTSIALDPIEKKPLARYKPGSVVTNGCIDSGRFQNLLPFIDAMNIDLKAFTDSFYQEIKGSLETVKTNIALASPRCHLELTCLVIPGENDSRQEMEAMCDFIASVSPQIPLHITRFFPRHKYARKEPTPLKTLEALKRIAQKTLDYVFVGNV
jgi:pyruvate-formate lyase-activating enzyme